MGAAPSAVTVLHNREIRQRQGRFWCSPNTAGAAGQDGIIPEALKIIVILVDVSHLAGNDLGQIVVNPRSQALSAGDLFLISITLVARPFLLCLEVRSIAHIYPLPFAG